MKHRAINLLAGMVLCGLLTCVMIVLFVERPSVLGVLLAMIFLIGTMSFGHAMVKSIK